MSQGNYKVERENNIIILKMIHAQKLNYGTFFAALLSGFLILTPIFTIILLNIDITFGTIIVYILACVISSYFIRLFLWNRYGEEVYRIEDQKLTHYNDYKIYKDRHETLEFKNIEIGFFMGDKLLIDYQESHLQDKTSTSVIAIVLDERILQTHKELPISEIIEIANSIKEL